MRTSAQRSPDARSSMAGRHPRSNASRSNGFTPDVLPSKLGNQALLGLLDSGVLQAKLRVGPVNDPLEREADRVAEQVTRPNALAPGPIAAAHPDVQRKCAACAAGGSCPKCAAEEDRLQRKPLLSSGSSVLQRQPEEKEDEPLQAQAASPQGVHAGPGLDAGLNRLRGRGSPLPAAARSYFEPRFGRDFTPVRVHTGPQAASLARSIDAQAFTVNRDMVFGAGRYQPETPAGRRLLAHELTHVVQQSGGVPSRARHAPANPVQRQAGGGAAARQHRFEAEGVGIVVRRSCDRDGFGTAVVEAGTREALRRIFHTECIEESRRTAMQRNLTRHGLDIRCSRSRAFCAEATGFHIPANILTVGIRSFADDPAAAGCEGGLSSILHEIVHLTRGFEGEQLPDSCENSCFGTSRGDPELCRDIDVHGRRP